MKKKQTKILAKQFPKGFLLIFQTITPKNQSITRVKNHEFENIIKLILIFGTKVGEKK